MLLEPIDYSTSSADDTFNVVFPYILLHEPLVSCLCWGVGYEVGVSLMGHLGLSSLAMLWCLWGRLLMVPLLSLVPLSSAGIP